MALVMSLDCEVQAAAAGTTAFLARYKVSMDTLVAAGVVVLPAMQNGHTVWAWFRCALLLAE